MKLKVIISLFALLPVWALAHTKWFVDDTLPTRPVEINTNFLMIVSVLIILLVIIGIFFEKRKWLAFDFLNPTMPHSFPRAASVFAMITGVFLIIAGSYSYLFAPNLTQDYGIPMYLIFAQIAIGLAFLLGVGSRVAGILLMILWGTLFYYTSWIDALENIWVLSTAIFISLMGNDYFSVISISFFRDVFAPFKKYALSTLRLGTGATLMILGLSEKIMAPEYGLNFLEEYQWNFIQNLGLNFPDYLFILSAGAVEFLFGLIFVLGVVTRLNALVVAIVFTIPLFILGPIELTGHLPHFAAIILLLIFGGGGHFTFFSDKKYR